MIDPKSSPQVTVLDAGGQYCHLIARKVRDLGVYAEVRPSDTPAAELKGRRAIIISGGPSSVYEEGSPTVDPAIFASGAAVLGICYGQQLMAHKLGGVVTPGDKGEYGLATLDVIEPNGFFAQVPSRQQIWMSHRDTVSAAPAGFRVTGSTSTCAIAAIADLDRRLYGVQFHPEVIHTTHGKQLLTNFLFPIAKCERDWEPLHRIPQIEDEIRAVIGERNVFFFVSGGVDSTVAFTLCLRALGPERVRGVYVDTGLMREGETEFVRRTFEQLGHGVVSIEDASAQFLSALAGVTEPERKRHIIGEAFLEVQERIIESLGLLDGHWVLGQGTIYPDTIESGGTEKAATIKTHHNRVAGVQRLLEAGRIVEPLASLYKDEVRIVGRELGVPQALLDRHPFPGPGLAIRCLCSDVEAPLTHDADGWVVPVRSVGVQGDFRTYAAALAFDEFPAAGLHDRGTEATNRRRDVNRVIARVDSIEPLASMRVRPSTLTADRLARLRRADAIVRRVSDESGFEQKVWQFPVVLIPAGTEARPDSIVLRPIDSVDGMTAESVLMDEPLLRSLADELLSIDGIAAVFYDLTHKPPATIEWE